MNKIIVASYMGSGSSAVTDLLSEYEDVACPNGSFEYIFLHCPNGLFDLEDKLLIGNNALRSDEALRSFEQAMHDLYENNHWWFGDYRNKVSASFVDYVERFLSDICTSSFSSFWYEQEKLDKRTWNLNRVKRKLGAKHYDLLETQLRMAFPKPDEFYSAARSFINSIVEDITRNLENHTILLDQLLLPHNLWRIGNYFDPNETRIIVVSRDPRDVFALNKYVWRIQGDSLPLPLDAQEFCAYYRRMRETERQVDSEMVLRINFEDLVLHYDKTKNTIEKFVGQSWLKAHTHKKQRFNPDVSKRNVGLFAFSEESKMEAMVIERCLEEYLYPFANSNLDSGDIELAF